MSLLLTNSFTQLRLSFSIRGPLWRELGDDLVELGKNATRHVLSVNPKYCIVNIFFFISTKTKILNYLDLS